MAGPTPRRWSTGVSRGSGVRPAFWAAAAIAARRAGGREGESRGEVEVGVEVRVEFEVGVEVRVEFGVAVVFEVEVGVVFEVGVDSSRASAAIASGTSTRPAN